MRRFDPTLLAFPLLILTVSTCGPTPGTRNARGPGPAAPDAVPASGGSPGTPDAPARADGDVMVPPPAPGVTARPSPAPGVTARPSLAPGVTARPPAGGWTHRPAWNASSFAGHKAYEDAIVRHVNTLRRGLGLKPLAVDERLRVGARQHTVEMIRKRYYAHTSPVAAWKSPHQRACHAGYLEPFVSENIGMISGYPDVAHAMFESWRKSPGHYKNMVDAKVSRIGVGLTSTVRSGMTIWIGTQLFGASPLDLRNLSVRREQRRVLRLSVTLETSGGLEIKAWRGRQFAGTVPRAGTRHTFTVDLLHPVRTSVRFGFAVKVGHQTPLVCAQADVRAGGRVSSSRVTYHPLCRRILGIQATGRVLRVQRRLITGEARANVAEAAKGTRYFFNKTWGATLPLTLGRWVRFSQALPSTNRVDFSLVLGKHQKDYLVLDFSKANPFRCP